jgi:hypothetical protein
LATCSPACWGCAPAGLASVGVVAIDGTKMSANGSINANRDFGQIAREILAEAADIDRCEDELYGGGGGDELPEPLRTGDGRRKTVGEAKDRLEASAATLPRRRPAMTRRSPWARSASVRPEGRPACVREGRQGCHRRCSTERATLRGEWHPVLCAPGSMRPLNVACRR